MIQLHSNQPAIEENSESKVEVIGFDCKPNSRMENEIKLLNCKFCESKFININSLTKHIQKNHLKNLTISTHMQKPTEKVTKSKKIEESVKIKLVHKNHKNTTITYKQKIFNCAICNSTFTQNSALTRHIELVHLKSFEIFLTRVDFHHSQRENYGNHAM